VRLLAQGGMAAVWEGHDGILARSVAIKILHPHLAADQSFLERFRQEAVAAARLSHPNVVATYDAGMAGTGTAFIVMELVRGRTLRQYLGEHGALPFPMVAGIGGQIADALAHAHAAGLIHRDIKPANVLLEEIDGEEVPRAKVTDFGIAKAAEGLGADLTRTGTVLGTPKYLSPEQIEGTEPDARTDLYALGVVLFEMLTGRPPFRGATDMATAVQTLNSTPPHAREFRPDVPFGMDELVDRLLAKRPEDRPSSAAAVRQALSTTNAGGRHGAIFGPVGWENDATRTSRNGSVPPSAPSFATAATGRNEPWAGKRWQDSAAEGNGATGVLSSAADPGSTSVLAAPGARNGPGGPITGERQPTPVPAGRPSPRRRPNWPGRIVAGLVVLALVVVVMVVTGQDSGRHSSSPPATSQPPATTAPLTLQNASVFHVERNADDSAGASYAFDGDLSTSWHTDTYFTPSFGNLRKGLGLAIQLNGGHKLHQLKVYSPSDGWSAEVYAADAVPDPPSMGPWGRVLDNRARIAPGWTTFNLGGAQGSTVLLWLTYLGSANMVKVAEVQIS
jgi:serine/threonine-protein kinase